jgi:transglutaminase-like putative cysteine protease
MKLLLDHHTVYTFSHRVFLEPHILRFKPRSDPQQELEFFELKITPEPSGRYEFLDENDNQAVMVWFDGEHKTLALESHAELQMIERNPFGFIIYPYENNQMPVQYTSSNILDFYLHISENQLYTDDYSKQLMNLFGQNTVDFLISVTRSLHEKVEKTVRDTGPPHPPDRTLKEGKGSCRDLAVLEMEILRRVGFASRFVSGYSYSEDGENHELHAWVEVFIPGAGWMGFDPSAGLRVTENYIPVSSGALPAGTLPVLGSFRGTADSEMKSSIRIEKI